MGDVLGNWDNKWNTIAIGRQWEDCEYIIIIFDNECVEFNKMVVSNSFFQECNLMQHELGLHMHSFLFGVI